MNEWSIGPCQPEDWLGFVASAPAAGKEEVSYRYSVDVLDTLDL